MSANTGNSGVRNLRAMFENKVGDQSTSPPSRGRSPSGSINSVNSRPVSKVRASFVAVERPGDIGAAPQWGLRKSSDVSSMAEAKDSDITRTNTVESQALQTTSPTSPHTSKDSFDGGLGSILKGSSFEGTPKRAQENSKPEKVSQPADKPQAPKYTGVESRAAEMIKRMQSNGKPGPPPTTNIVTDSAAKPLKNPHPRPTVKPSPDSPKPPKLEKASPRTPKEQTFAKTPASPAAAKPLQAIIRGGPAKVKGVMESAKRASEAREAVKKEPPKPTEKEPPKPTAKKLAEPKPKVKVNGIKKETVKSPTSTISPRSPTKTGKLPSAVTATTAAATAKHEPQSPTQVPARKSAPRASLPAVPFRATSATTASSLHKKSSRASLAPNGNERPKSRVSVGKTDAGFLERMMRPTQSSAQKTHEKVQVNSPPRSKAAQVNTKASSLKGSRKSDQSQASRIYEEEELGEPVSHADETAAPKEDSSFPPRQPEVPATGTDSNTKPNGSVSATAEA